MNEYTGEKQIDIATIPPDVKPESIDTLGNYALHIKWDDGHGSGIFPFTLIKSLSE